MHTLTTHKSGLRLITHTMPDSPSVSLNIFVHTGSRYENAENNGVAHFFEHMVFKGTTLRPSPEQIAFELESIGAEVNAGTDREFTTYYIRVLKPNIEKGAEILFDAFLHSLLVEEETDKERGVIFEEMKMYQDDPSYFAEELFTSNIYPVDPYGRSVLGTVETLKNLNSDAIRDFFQKNYCFENTVIAAAGNIKHEELESLVDRYFDTHSYVHGNDLEIPYVDNNFTQETDIYKKDIQQAQFRMGTYTVSHFDPDKYKISVATDILGNGLSSKLSVEIREKLGLAYTIGAESEHWSKSGYMTIGAGLAPENIETVQKICIREMNKISNGELSLADLNRAKELAKSSILMNLDTTENWVMFLGLQECIYKKIETIDEIVKKFDEVSIEDVVKVMQMLTNQKWHTTVVRGESGSI
jgi:predicted Zn-dependent peptidase